MCGVDQLVCGVDQLYVWISSVQSGSTLIFYSMEVSRLGGPHCFEVHVVTGCFAFFNSDDVFSLVWFLSDLLNIL